MTAFASGNSCFISSPVQKLKNSAKQNSWTVCRFSLWNSARCFRIQRKLTSGLWLGAFGKKRIFMCQSTFATRFCLRHCVFLCKGTKLQKAALFAIVCRFPPWYAFSPMKPAFFFANSAQAEFGCFGLGRLVGRSGLFRCQSRQYGQKKITPEIPGVQRFPPRRSL